MHLTKHHGLGNDFLVLLDLDDRQPIDAELARVLCDRRRGVGADGLIRVSPGHDGAEVTMTLRNADGSPAEMSGNGARCLGQAVARSRGVDTLDLEVATGGGPRRVEVRPGPDARTAQVRVDMGPVRLTRVEEHEAEADTGNPHLVLRVDDPGAADLLALGRAHPDVNVEVVAPGPDPDSLVLRVHERGAGITEACGTGSCAAAAAAHEWGLVGSTVVVHNPGGAVIVELKPESALLTGPAVHVADIEVPWH